MSNEEFCMQVDAHSDVVQDWDVKLMETWAKTENEYAVISTKPMDISLMQSYAGKTNNHKVPHLCQAEFDHR